MIRKEPIILAVVLLFVLPVALLSWIKTELTAEERRSKLRDTLGGHPTANTGTYKGQLWKNEQTLGRVLLGETAFARCDVHSVMVGENKIVNDWIFMEERDAINAAVYTKEGKFLFFRQRKYAIPGETFSPVGGFINDGESPFDAARREVWEELGVGSSRTKDIIKSEGTSLTDEDGKSPFGKYLHKMEHDVHGIAKGNVASDEPDWVFLGRYRTMANRGGGFIYTYLLVNAIPLVEGGGTSAYLSKGDDEAQALHLLTKEETSKAILNGEFQEVKWAATLSLGLLHLLQHEQNQPTIE